MNRQTSIWLLAVLVFLPIAGPSQGAPPPSAVAMPQVLYVEGQDFPIWVDEREVLLSSGEVSPSLFHPLLLAHIEAYLKLPPRDGKIRLSRIDEDIVNAPVRRNLKEAVDTSDLVAAFRVTGTARGFHGDHAGTLLRIEPVRVFKGESTRPEYFIFVPVGEVQVGGTTFAKEDSRYPALPVEGDQVVLFLAPDYRNAGTYLWQSDDGSLVTIKSKSGASLPQRYVKSDADLVGARLEALEDLVERLSRRGRER